MEEKVTGVFTLNSVIVGDPLTLSETDGFCCPWKSGNQLRFWPQHTDAKATKSTRVRFFMVLSLFLGEVGRSGILPSHSGSFHEHYFRSPTTGTCSNLTQNHHGQCLKQFLFRKWEQGLSSSHLCRGRESFGPCNLFLCYRRASLHRFVNERGVSPMLPASICLT